MHPLKFRNALMGKLARWFDASDVERLADRAHFVLESIYTHVPPCVIFCLVSTWCNAWCTNRRFQQKGRCQLCLECHGEDSLEHYACCNFHWDVFARKTKQPNISRSVQSFFVLSAQNEDEMVLQACHVYAVKRAVDHRRYDTGIRSLEWVQNLIWNGHCTAAMFHRGLARRYAAIHAVANT